MIAAITGPTGSIGRDLIQSHLDAGDSVIAIVNPKSLRKENLPESDRLTVLECGLGDYQKIMGNLRCDVFYHLAWDGTGPDARNDTGAQSKNIAYSLGALKLAHSWRSKKFIFAGSQAEYGRLDKPIISDTPANPVTAYGIAKNTAGMECATACKQMGMGFNRVRILSVYGRYDSNDLLVQYVISKLSKGESPELSPCEQIWDLMYSKDCAEALRLIALKGKNGRTYNVCSGDARPLKEHILCIRDVVAPDEEIVFGARDYYPGQTMMLAADTRELFEDTGFRPRYSLEDGIRDMLASSKEVCK